MNDNEEIIVRVTLIAAFIINMLSYFVFRNNFSLYIAIYIGIHAAFGPLDWYLIYKLYKYLIRSD